MNPRNESQGQNVASASPRGTVAFKLSLSKEQARAAIAAADRGVEPEVAGYQFTTDQVASEAAPENEGASEVEGYWLRINEVSPTDQAPLAAATAPPAVTVEGDWFEITLALPIEQLRQALAAVEGGDMTGAMG